MRQTVRVVLQETGEQVPVQVYVWKDSKTWLKLDEEWDYSTFRKAHLKRWIGLE